MSDRIINKQTSSQIPNYGVIVLKLSCRLYMFKSCEFQILKLKN